MDNKIKRGQILRKLRLSKQMTQDESAKNFGISQQTYQKYESGKTEPPYDLLCDFAVFYGVTTDYLLGLESASPVIEPMEVLGLKKSVDDDEFMRLYNELPDYAKQIFVDVMAKLAQATEPAKPQLKKRHVKRLGDIEDTLKQEETTQQATLQPDIQISKRAIARSKDNPFRDAPTPEQIASFTPVPEDTDL
ncbi:MAG: helix-turn-helix domain-containing protein [Ruminococcus sp.]|nr:helix-turn-helix domain-containing protein [Ruminococcus sp.]